jgi:hypothetical protein
VVGENKREKRKEKSSILLPKKRKAKSNAHVQQQSSQVKFLLSTQIQNSPPLVLGAGSLRRRQQAPFHDLQYMMSSLAAPA